MEQLTFPKIEIEPADLDRLESIVARFEKCARTVDDSGKPSLPETCKWKKGVDCIALFYGECGVRSLEVHNFCPYCGRRIEVIDG